MEPTQTKNPITIPLAIVVAGVLVAGAIFLRGSGSAPEGGGTKGEGEVPPLPSLADITLRPVDEARDHIRGNPDADIVFVEFSDTECPFCKRFHPTMQKVIAEFGKSGKVAWVYRQFPIVGLHSKAPKESEATECAAELGGNQKFWEYLDRIFEITPSNDGLEGSELPRIASDVGLDEKQFNECLSSGREQTKVDGDYDDGVAAGVQGTPHSVLVLKTPVSEKDKSGLLELMEPFRDPRGSLPISFSNDRLRIGLSGALPFEAIKATIDILLK
jgi:protein-disulfide isomerase